MTLATNRDGARSEQSAQATRVENFFRGRIPPGGPGCAAGVYRNGEVAFAGAYGLANLEDGRAITTRTAFNLGSASKPFTALAALLLEQRGRLSLADDVRRWVPELPNYGRPIRVRDLLQHTSGLRDFETLQILSGRPATTMAEFLGLVTAQRALNFDPGTRHEYSHTDFGVLGLIVERAVGVPFGEHMRAELFAPLGMKDAFIDHVPARAVRTRSFGHAGSASGGGVRFPNSRTFGGDNLYASIEDLARLDAFFESPAVGGAALVARVLGRPTLPDGETIPYAYGLRLGSYRGLRTVSRGGHPPGHRAEFIRFPDQRIAVAVLCNADDLDAPGFARSVADIYIESGTRPPTRPDPPPAVTMSARELAAFAGVYRPIDDPWNLLPIEVRNGVLGEVIFDDVTDEMFYPMTPAGNGRFFEIGSTGNVARIAFESAAPGAPLRLQIAWNDGPPEVLERIADADLWRPSRDALAEYAGLWFSPDLDAAWRLEVRGARLLLRRAGQRDVTLRAVARDRFLRAFGPEGETSVRLQFQRDGRGSLSGLTVSTRPGDDSVQRLVFVRLPG